MSTVFNLPDLGEGLTDSEIVTWLVAEGDRVALNQPLAEVETAKAVVEVPSPHAGIISKLHAAAGETIDVGAPFVEFIVDGDPEAVASDPAPATPQATNTPKLKEERLDVLVGSVRISKGEVRRTPRAWPVKPFTRDASEDAVSSGDNGTSHTVSEHTVSEHTASEHTASEHTASEQVRATPPVRLYAKKMGVNLRSVPASDGTLTRSDIDAFISGGSDGAFMSSDGSDGVDSSGSIRSGSGSGSGSGRSGSGISNSGSGRQQQRGGLSDVAGVRTERVQGIRKHSAAAMTKSYTEVPHATVFLDVDVTETSALVADLKASTREGAAPSFLSLVCRAIVRACKLVPETNASFNASEGTIKYFESINLGIAMNTPRGLVVASVDQANDLDAVTITEQISKLREKALAGELTPAQLSSSTITISNVGVFGVDSGSPIINPGESMILALGAIRRKPWEHKGEIALRDVVTLAASFDHRLIDGAEASKFITAVGEVLERPGLMLAK